MVLYVLHLSYSTFAYKTKQKNETVKEGGLVLKIMHDSCETNLPEKMAFKTFLYALRVRSPLKLNYLDYKTLVKSSS